MRPAGFWIRSAAFLIDLVLLNAVEFVLVYAISRALGLDPFSEQIVDGFFSIAFYVYYYLFFQVRHQTTLGKRWLGLRLTSTDGSAVTRGQCALRLFGYLLSLLMMGCGFLMVAFHPEKRAFHDLISRTRVERIGS
jgi:uncharacterized RDD family membrane protein YckC